MKLTKNLFILFILLAFTVSCTAEDELEVPVHATPINFQNLDEKGEYHVLIIGNSLSRDAFSYVPAVIVDLCPNITIDFNIYYRSGAGLLSHWKSVKQGKTDHLLDTFSQLEYKWITTDAMPGEELIRSKNWDLIILQEGNILCRKYEPTRDNIQSFSTFIRSINPETKIAYLMVPAQPEGNSSLGDYTSDEVWNMFAETSNSLFVNQDVDYIIPCGTAIQNARHTYLDEVGKFGHLSYDGIHLQEGIPCAIEAFTAAQCFFNIFSINASIQKSSLQITQQIVSAMAVPGRHGGAVQGSEGDYRLCKQCAIYAINDPYSISTYER
jgi:hypothetical protein